MRSAALLLFLLIAGAEQTNKQLPEPGKRHENPIQAPLPRDASPDAPPATDVDAPEIDAASSPDVENADGPLPAAVYANDPGANGADPPETAPLAVSAPAPQFSIDLNQSVRAVERTAGAGPDPTSPDAGDALPPGDDEPTPAPANATGDAHNVGDVVHGPAAASTERNQAPDAADANETAIPKAVIPPSDDEQATPGNALEEEEAAEGDDAAHSAADVAIGTISIPEEDAAGDANPTLSVPPLIEAANATDGTDAEQIAESTKPADGEEESPEEEPKPTDADAGAQSVHNEEDVDETPSAPLEEAISIANASSTPSQPANMTIAAASQAAKGTAELSVNATAAAAAPTVNATSAPAAANATLELTPHPTVALTAQPANATGQVPFNAISPVNATTEYVSKATVAVAAPTENATTHMISNVPVAVPTQIAKTAQELYRNVTTQLISNATVAVLTEIVNTAAQSHANAAAPLVSNMTVTTPTQDATVAATATTQIIAATQTATAIVVRDTKVATRTASPGQTIPPASTRVAPRTPTRAAQVKCGQNETVGADGKCKCRTGFTADSGRCFRCSSGCHNDATCVWPGRCECRSPLAGDGVKGCYDPVPVVVSIFPVDGPVEGGTIINVSLKDPIPAAVKVAFCRFGSTTVRVLSASKNTALCQSPPHAAEIVAFAFSYDRIKWSANAIKFKFEDEVAFADLFRFSPVMMVALATLVGIICVICRCAAKADRLQLSDGSINIAAAQITTKDADSDDPEQPFLPKKRGHMD